MARFNLPPYVDMGVWDFRVSRMVETFKKYRPNTDRVGRFLDAQNYLKRTLINSIINLRFSFF